MLLDSREFECIYTESWDACLKGQFDTFLTIILFWLSLFLDGYKIFLN